MEQTVGLCIPASMQHLLMLESMTHSQRINRGAATCVGPSQEYIDFEERMYRCDNSVRFYYGVESDEPMRPLPPDLGHGRVAADRTQRHHDRQTTIAESASPVQSLEKSDSDLEEDPDSMDDDESKSN